MSKLSFRARALDCSKPMPVYRSEEIPDLPDFAAINRAVPQMPTGMEKEEETEHHLQRALSAQQVYGTAEALVIPVPDIDTLGDDYDRLYPTDYRVSKQYIHIQALGMDQEIPDYDMDSGDEVWLNEQTKKMELTPVQFEEMMDRLEKGSGQQVVSLQEAKLLLKQDDDLTMSVYDYWLNKKLRMQHALIPQVKSEKRDGTTTNNPYVAFRRRTEKMQTRKNRKNDEASYEKMLKLRRDLNKAVSILEMIKKREKCKKELLQLTIEILEKRYQMEDFCGQHLTYAESQKTTRPAFYPIFEQYKVTAPKVPNDIEVATTNRKPKREYKKRKHKQATSLPCEAVVSYLPSSYEVDIIADAYSSDEERQSPDLSGSDQDDENDPDGRYAFRRKKFCSYQAPLGCLGDWPWSGAENGVECDGELLRYRYCLTSVARPRPRFIGYARRRIGRGGRMLLDRASMEARGSGEPWDTELEHYLESRPSTHVGPPAAPELLRSSSGDSRLPRPLHFWPGATTLDRPLSDASGAGLTSSQEVCSSVGLACSQEAAECRDSFSDRDCYVISAGSSLLVQTQEAPLLVLTNQQQSRGQGAGSCSLDGRRQQELPAAAKPLDLGQQAVAVPIAYDADSQHLGSKSLPASAVASGSRLAHSFSSQPSSRFVVDSAQAALAVSALTTSGTNGAHKAVGMGQANGPQIKGARQPASSTGATPYVVATSDAAAAFSSAGNCGSSGVPISMLSTKPGSAASFPAVLRVGATPNESGDSLSMSSLVQSELDYGETLLRPGINNLDAVTSMEVS